MSLEPKLRSWWFLRYWRFNKQYCKGTAYSSLDNLVWVSIIQLALRSSESTINSSLPSCSHHHGAYYIVLLGSVVISVLICVPVATGAQTRLVQYKQLVMYDKVPYLNISLISWAIQRSDLRRLLYYIQVCSGMPPSAPLQIPWWLLVDLSNISANTDRFEA